MGFFNRISTIFKANVNAALDTAEDPEKMLNQITTEMQEQLVKVKQQVAVAIANEKRLQKDYENEREQADRWEQKATLALQKDNEDLAKRIVLVDSLAIENLDANELLLSLDSLAVNVVTVHGLLSPYLKKQS